MLNFFRRLAIPLVGALLAAQALASDSTFNDMWLKVQVKASGYLVPLDGTAPRKGGIATTAYLHLTLATAAGTEASLPGVTYNYELWTRDLAGTWQATSTGTETIETSDGRVYFTADMGLTVVFADGPTVDAYVTCALTVKRDKTGAVKSATITSLGGEVYDGTFGDSTVRGGLRIKGKSVKPEQLPF